MAPVPVAGPAWAEQSAVPDPARSAHAAGPQAVAPADEPPPQLPPPSHWTGAGDKLPPGVWPLTGSTDPEPPTPIHAGQPILTTPPAGIPVSGPLAGAGPFAPPAEPASAPPYGGSPPQAPTSGSPYPVHPSVAPLSSGPPYAEPAPHYGDPPPAPPINHAPLPAQPSSAPPFAEPAAQPSAPPAPSSGAPYAAQPYGPQPSSAPPYAAPPAFDGPRYAETAGQPSSAPPFGEQPPSAPAFDEPRYAETAGQPPSAPPYGGPPSSAPPVVEAAGQPPAQVAPFGEHAGYGAGPYGGPPQPASGYGPALPDGAPSTYAGHLQAPQPTAPPAPHYGAPPAEHGQGLQPPSDPWATTAPFNHPPASPWATPPTSHQQQAPPQQPPPPAPPSTPPPSQAYTEPSWAPEAGAPTAEEFARRRAAKPADPVARTGVRAAVNKSTLGLVKLAPGRDEIEFRQDIEKVRRNFGGLRQVTVVNPKGGAGKTVAVLLLAMTFGQKRGGYVLAWDNNETQGTLGMRAQQDFHSRTVRDMLRDLSNFQGARGRVGDLSQYVRSQGEGMFDVLASDESATAGEMLTAHAFGEIREVVSRFYKLIVVDTGNNVRAQNWQAAIDATDQLVVTMSARNDSAETAARMLDHLEQSGRTRLVRQAVTVVSMPPRARDIDLPPIQRHFAARTRAVLVAPYDRLIDTGEPLRYGQLSPATLDAWLKVAAAVSEGL
jgi:MinD-like ATPase involved in chromosome partitioning or flagellar assembly